MHPSRVSNAVLLLLLSAVFVVPGPALSSSKPANVQEVSCNGSEIAWEIAPEASVESLACSLGTHEGDPSLIVDVSLKNISDRDLRFRLTLFLDDLDKGVAWSIPLKGNPPVMKPGDVQSIKIPFMKTTELSRQMSVAVTVIE